jgi:hypothetical protein
LTTSEADGLLQSLEKYWELVSETCDGKKETSSSSYEMTITKFLSCFEVATVSQKRSENEATTSSVEERSLRVRKNISSETLARLGRLTGK